MKKIGLIKRNSK